MAESGSEKVFLDLRQSGKAEEIAKLFPPPAYFTAVIDGAAVPDKAALMAALAPAFRFPAYFGGNWDALLDCLRSLPNEIPSKKGYILAIKNSKMLLSAAPEELETLTAIVSEAKQFLAEKAGTDLSIAMF